MAYKITKADIEAYYRSNDYYKQAYPTERRLTNAINKEFKQYEELVNTPLVKKINVRMNWVRNSTWGMNPHATAYVTYVNGATKTLTGYKASGAGYSKSMHLLEQILNDCAVQNLIAFFENGAKGEQRGVHLPQYAGGLPYYSLGSEEGKFANFEIDHYVNDKTYDAYDIIFHNPSGTLLGKRVTAKKMKGTKTAVWGRKPYRNETVSSLENAVKRMI